jgi:hypothetical protein
METGSPLLEHALAMLLPDEGGPVLTLSLNTWKKVNGALEAVIDASGAAFAAGTPVSHF